MLASKKEIVIFASGNGSNTQKIIEHFKGTSLNISLIITNKKTAGVIHIAKENDIETLVIDRDALQNIHLKIKENIDLIVLAGFLLKIPKELIIKFPNKIINIHPSLLPKFGGKGMYGMHVHQAVINAQEKKSGITIHYVNENYDEGEYILQKACAVDNNETPETLSAKVRLLEHEFFAQTIEKLLINEL